MARLIRPTARELLGVMLLASPEAVQQAVRAYLQTVAALPKVGEPESGVDFPALRASELPPLPQDDPCNPWIERILRYMAQQEQAGDGPEKP